MVKLHDAFTPLFSILPSQSHKTGFADRRHCFVLRSWWRSVETGQRSGQHVVMGWPWLAIQPLSHSPSSTRTNKMEKLVVGRDKDRRSVNRYCRGQNGLGKLTYFQIKTEFDYEKLRQVKTTPCPPLLPRLNITALSSTGGWRGNGGCG